MLRLNWVENNVAPERVVLSKIKEGKEIMTRPVFPYPSVTLYNGFGDPNIESSFNEKE